MTVIDGLHWPDTVGTAYGHALMHVRASLDVSLRRCIAQQRTRTAVQAGGNVGLWPRRMAAVFARVITFEPDAISRECVIANVPASVEVRSEAVSDRTGVCGLKRKGLGSHKLTEGDGPILTMLIDDLALTDLDLLQLDVEGHEGPALKGAEATIARCRPIIHVELRDLDQRYGMSAADVVAWLEARHYHQVATAQGCDAVFEARP